jgi:hypothetical protein
MHDSLGWNDGPATTDHSKLEAFEAREGINDEQVMEAAAVASEISAAHGDPPYPSEEEAAEFTGGLQV